MPFTPDVTAIWKNTANVLGSLMPIAWPFVGAALALFIFGALIYLIHKWQTRS